MGWPWIYNNIFFEKEFITKLMSLIPNKTMEYWDISVFDIEKTEGLIRYYMGILDVIYIMVNCKYQIPDGETTLKFNYNSGNYVFDSIYIRYDVKTKKPSFPTEYRYNNDLDVIATYRWNQSIEEYLSNLILCTQYKQGNKLKEYMIGNDKKVPEFLKELNGVLNVPEDIYNNNIDYLFAKNNKNLIYYNIR
jgi:hypothetical protein